MSARAPAHVHTSKILTTCLFVCPPYTLIYVQIISLPATQKHEYARAPAILSRARAHLGPLSWRRHPYRAPYTALPYACALCRNRHVSRFSPSVTDILLPSRQITAKTHARAHSRASCLLPTWAVTQFIPHFLTRHVLPVTTPLFVNFLLRKDAAALRKPDGEAPHSRAGEGSRRARPRHWPGRQPGGFQGQDECARGHGGPARTRRVGWEDPGWRRAAGGAEQRAASVMVTVLRGRGATDRRTDGRQTDKLLYYLFY